jgi:hypothetical protein
MATLKTIKDAAAEQTGLNQFGDDSFEEGGNCWPDSE